MIKVVDSHPQKGIIEPLGLEKNRDIYKQICQPINIWVEYLFKGTLSRKEKKSYEDFCCGYLLYYDDITRNGSQSHRIAFSWITPKKGRTTLIIYLDPPAENCQLYHSYPKLKSKRKLDPQKDYWRKASDNFLSPATSFSKDPHQPPPPPPPSA